MSDRGLVSLITPCYNGEAHIHRLLNSVLDQDYANIEHIIVDDGSVDRTAEIISSYIPIYEKYNKKLIYVYQENTGAGGALNLGLKMFSGAYLTWPDADDYYNSDKAISKMVESLLDCDNSYGIVRCDAILRSEETLEAIGKFSDSRPFPEKDDLFHDCIHELDFWYTPGCYLTSARVLDSVIDNRDIFVNNDVQNWQMLLPILYKYKCYYIHEPLHNYLVRGSSYCHQPMDHELVINRTYIHEEIIKETLKRIKMTERSLKDHLAGVEWKYDLKRVQMSFDYRKENDFFKYYSIFKLKYPEKLTFKLRLKKLVIKYPKLIMLISYVRDKYKF